MDIVDTITVIQIITICRGIKLLSMLSSQGHFACVRLVVGISFLRNVYYILSLEQLLPIIVKNFPLAYILKVYLCAFMCRAGIIFIRGNAQQ